MDHHKLCDDTKAAGCDRCRPLTSTTCCDLCDPEEFEKYNIDVPEKVPKISSKSRIKPFDMTPKDTGFKQALQNWREKTAVTKFRASTIRTLGVRIFMSEQVLTRIVECAHYNKILTVEDLSKETIWDKERVTQYGEEIVNMIFFHYPPAPVLEREESSTRKRVKCGACGAEGHISE
jgi:hypothetical protein